MNWSLISNRKPYFWTTFHIILGIISTISHWFLFTWFIILILKSLSILFIRKSEKNIYKYIAFVSYLISFELLARLAKSAPFIPYESSKYLMIILFLLGILFLDVRIKTVGLLMTILIIPAFFYDFSGESGLAGRIFNGFAPLGLALGITFVGNIKLNIESINSILRLIWFTSISALVFVIIKTPDFDSIDFNLGANFETTGGESSNQVSSILGLGMVVSFYSWLARLNFSGNRILDLVFIFSFGFQGLLTFSRGGIFVGGLAILLLYFTYSQHNIRSKKIKLRKPIYYLILVTFLGIFTFQTVDEITGGKLSLRYKGETEGTLIGSKEKNFDVLTTNRSIIFIGDLYLWRDYIVSGVGVGASKYLRAGDSSNPHIELSRLLAEHGLLGFFYFIILFYLGIKIYKNRVSDKHRSIMLTIFFVGLATCFHSATRTFITPLLIVLSTISPLNHVTLNEK